MPSEIIVTFEYDDFSEENKQDDLLGVLEDSKNSNEIFNSVEDLFDELEK